MNSLKEVRGARFPYFCETALNKKWFPFAALTPFGVVWYKWTHGILDPFTNKRIIYVYIYIHMEFVCAVAECSFCAFSMVKSWWIDRIWLRARRCGCQKIHFCEQKPSKPSAAWERNILYVYIYVLYIHIYESWCARSAEKIVMMSGFFSPFFECNGLRTNAFFFYREASIS